MGFLQMALLRMLENHFRRGDLSALGDLGEVMRGSHLGGLQPMSDLGYEVMRGSDPSGLQPTFMQPIPPSVRGDLSPFGSHRPASLSGLLEPGVSPGFSLKEYIQQLPQGPNPAFIQPIPPSAWSDLSPLTFRRRPLRIRELLRGFGRSG